mgnify:CR=1 FL=1
MTTNRKEIQNANRAYDVTHNELLEHIITLKSGAISSFRPDQMAMLMQYVVTLVAQGTHFTYTTFEA